MTIGFESHGDFNKTEDWLRKLLRPSDLFRQLEKYGKMGVDALAAATPVESGETRDSWSYQVIAKKGMWLLVWHNTHNVNGVQPAVLLQYGHGTRNGGYVQGRDYINPAIQPIMERMAAEGWKAVTA